MEKNARLIKNGELLEKQFKTQNENIDVCFSVPTLEKKCVKLVKKSPSNRYLIYTKYEKNKLSAELLSKSQIAKNYNDEILYHPLVSEYKDISLYKNYFEHDTTLLYIKKSNYAYNEKTDIFIDETKVCSIGKGEYYKLPVINGNIKCNVYFVDKNKRKYRFKAEESLNSEVVIILNEELSSCKAVIQNKPKSVKSITSEFLDTTKWKEVCKY